MALQWNWEDKIGEAVVFNYDKEVTYTLYDGNAFLIMLYEYTNDKGEEMWQMANFFADETHAKNCLGLNKGYDRDNMFNHKSYKLLKIRLNKNKYRYTKKLVDLLIKAFDNITIELYTDKEEN